MSEGKKLPISVVITAVDNVTYKVMAINEKLKRITAPVAKVQSAFKTLGDEAGLGKLAKGMGKIGETGKEFFGDLAERAAKVAAVSLAAAGAIFEITRSFADAGDEINTVSKRLGISTDMYQELSYAAKQANVDQETFTSSMDKFSKGIAEAAAGQGEAFVGFNALGVSVRDSTGHLRKLDDLLPEVADKLGAIKSEQLRAAVASKLFGREGAKLNGIFKQGSAGLAKLREDAHKVGAVMTPEQLAAAEEFDSGMKSVGATLLMVRNIVGAALAPKIVELGQKLQKYILDNKDKIAAWASAFADKLPGVIDGLIKLFSALGTVLSPVVSFIGVLNDTFGTTALVFAGLAAYMAPSLISFGKFAMSIGSFLPTLIRFGAILAGLVTWPVLLGAALVTAAVLVWKYWGPITEKLGQWWDRFKAFTGFGDSSLSTQGPASLGPAAGLGKTVDAAARSSTQTNDSHVVVDFNNLPIGARVDTKKSDGGLDLNMGYGLAAGVP